MKNPELFSIGQAWQYFIKSLEGIYPEKELHAIGREVFRHFFSIKPADRVLNPGQPFSAADLQVLEKVVVQLKKHTPLQHITGVAHFFDLEFSVNQNVLIPRPETEELVQWALDTIKEDFGSLSQRLSIFDVGTGSGCIAVSLASQLTGAKVCACDVSHEALKLASENAARNKQVVNFFHCDILNDEPVISDLDMVISNPPYVMNSEKPLMQPNVLEYEPALALFVSNDDPLLFYRAIARKAQSWLKPGGWLFFEINESLGRETKECIEKEGFIHVELKQDINGRDRMIRAVLGEVES